MTPSDARHMLLLELDAMAQSPVASQSQAFREAKQALRLEQYSLAAGWLESYYRDVADGLGVARGALVAEERRP